MSSNYSHVRGDTFSVLHLRQQKDGTARDLTGYQIHAELQHRAGQLVEVLAVTILDQASHAGEFVLSVPDTAAWPLARLRYKIQFTDPQGVITTSGCIDLRITDAAEPCACDESAVSVPILATRVIVGESACDRVAVSVGLGGTVVLTGADGADGADGKSAYALAVEQGFAGTLAEWLESLKADCGEPEVPEPVRRLLVRTGATEAANGEYQQFESDGTHELLTSFGVSGLTAELDPVDWMLPDSHEYRLVIQVPAGLDNLDPNTPMPPFVYLLITDSAVADLFTGYINVIQATLGYVVEPEPALRIQLQLSNDQGAGVLEEVYVPYLVDQSITLLYQPLQHRAAILQADGAPVLQMIDLPDYLSGQSLNMGLLFASFVPNTTLQISAYAETLARQVDPLALLEDRVDDLEQAMAAVDGLFDEVNGRIDQVNGRVDGIGSLIDDKISKSVQPSGVVDVAIDTKLTPALAAVEDYAWTVNPTARSLQGYDLAISQISSAMGQYFIIEIDYNKPDGQFFAGQLVRRTEQGVFPVLTQFGQRYSIFTINGTARLGVYTLDSGLWRNVEASLFLTSTHAQNMVYLGVSAPTVFLGYQSDVAEHVHLDCDSQISRLVLTQKPQRTITINALEAGRLQLFGGSFIGGLSNWSDLVVSGDLTGLTGLTVVDNLATLSLLAGDFWRVHCQIINPINSAGAVGGFHYKTLLHFERLIKAEKFRADFPITAIASNSNIGSDQYLGALLTTIPADQLIDGSELEFYTVTDFLAGSVAAGYTPYVKINGTEILHFGGNRQPVSTAFSQSRCAISNGRWTISNGVLRVIVTTNLAFSASATVSYHAVYGDYAIPANSPITVEFGYIISAAQTNFNATRQRSFLRRVL